MAGEEFWGQKNQVFLSHSFSFFNSRFVPFGDLKGNMQRNFLIVVVVGGHLISWNIPLTKSGVMFIPTP
jgi:hypothetical protein